MRDDDTLATPGVKEGFRVAGRVGRYVILDKLGEGGMGVVYSAYDDELDRTVALKLINPQGSPLSAHTRLVAEARTMARLQHPNVVAVFDAQTLGASVYVAMELVPGADLRAWRNAQPRTVAQILDVFVQAGRGLAAAHAAGIVHRDFKPANVLVGDDGRARVADFGLALGGPGGDAEETTDGGELVSQVTQSGGLVGTPAYMAPEQHQRHPATPLSDQFSYCMSLYETLCRRRPYTVDDLRGRPGAPNLADIPTRLRAPLERGLAADAKDRFPSMDALLRALARDPAASRRRWLAAGFAVLVVVAIAWVVAGRRGAAAAVCSGARAQLQGVWDDAQRARLRAEFLATRLPFADATWTGTAGALDAYAARWASAHTEACAATRLRGEQAEDVLARRMTCLDRRRQSLAATVNVLAEADAKGVENAVQAVRALPELDACANVASLLAQVAAPDHEPTRARIHELRSRLAEGEALKAAGSYDRALEIADSVAKAARPLAYASLIAEAELLRGDLLDEGGQFKAAEDALYEAVYAGEAGRNEEVVAEAWIDLLWVVGVRQRRQDDANRIGRLADAALTRYGDPPLLRGRYWDYLASVAAHQGSFEEMDALYRRALDVLERELGPDDTAVSDVRFNFGASAMRRRRFAEALPLFERALPSYLAAYGPDHPYTARCLHNLGAVLLQLGRPDDALDKLSLALSAREKLLGHDHPGTAGTVASIGETHLQKGDLGAARVWLTRALDIRRKGFGDAHGETADSLEKLAGLEIREGRLAEAEEHALQAVKVRDKPQPSHSLLAVSYHRLGEVYVAQGKRTSALAALDQAVAGYEQAGATWTDELARARALRAEAGRH